MNINTSKDNGTEEADQLIPKTKSGEYKNKAMEKEIQLKTWLNQISVPVYILVMIFAIASWIDINGLWVEVPLLVEDLPEGWSLPSYMVVIIQVANIGPLAYMIAHYIAPQRVKEWPVIYAIIFIGAATCVLLAFFWSHTSYIHGEEKSIPLLGLSALLSLVDCTSSVVFLPYMAMFKPQYMSAFYIGEGLSGLIPGIVGLIQGAGSDPTCVNETIHVYNSTTGINTTEHKLVPVYSQPLFSIEAFFFFLFAMIMVSGIAFTFLHFLPMCQNEKVKTSIIQNNEKYEYERPVEKSEPENLNDKQEQTTNTSYGATPEGSHNQILISSHGISEENKSVLTKSEYIIMLVITAWINGLTNGVLPSIQSFSSLPYSSLAYTLAVRLSTVANPLACFFALFVRTRSLVWVLVLTLAGTGLFVHQLTLAFLSPTPPLHESVMGEILVITSAVLLTGIFSYVKVTVASALREKGRRALMWCGGVTQVGSLIGAITAFILVNIVKVFENASSSWC